MIKGKNLIAHIIIALATLSGTLLVYPRLPARVPTQWGFSGEINSYGDRSSVLIMPFVMCAIVIMTWLLPRIDPRGDNYKRFGNSYVQMMLVLQIFFAFIQAIILIETLNPGTIQFRTLIMPGIGVLFLILGNVMPKLKHNYFVGVRTPWTLNDEENWYATHRVAGMVWFVIGALIACISFAPDPWGYWLFFALIAIAALIPTGYSCWFFMNRRKQS